MVLSSHSARKFFRKVQAVEERDCAENPEGTINEPPFERNVSEGTTDQGEWYDRRARYYSNAKHPGIAKRVTERTDEKHRNDEMSERQPISAVADERKRGISFSQAEPDKGEPAAKSGERLVCRQIVDPKPTAQERNFGEEGKRCDPADEEASDEQAQANSISEKGAGHDEP